MQKLRPIFFLTFAIASAAWANLAAAATVRIDYGYDTNNFFGVGTPARAAMDAAANFYSGILVDTLSAIQTPADFHGSLGGTAKWRWRRAYKHPSTGLDNPESDVPIAANEFVVLVGARNLPTGTLGLGGPGGYDQAGLRSKDGFFTSQENTLIDNTTNQFLNAVQTRGETSGFAAWGGTLSVDSDTPWHFSHTTLPAAGKYDLYSVLLHELGHALGLGASPAWNSYLSGLTFNGPQAKTAYGTGGPVPLAAPQGSDPAGHWSSAITSTVFGGSANQTPLMVPSFPVANRRHLTALDAAGLADIGWEVTLPAPIPGDYNRNGIVDAADYTIWRNTLGSTTDLRANGNNTGASANKIDQADYAYWKARFGNVSGSGSGSGAISVPEPACMTLSIIAAGIIARIRLKKRFTL